MRSEPSRDEESRRAMMKRSARVTVSAGAAVAMLALSSGVAFAAEKSLSEAETASIAKTIKSATEGKVGGGSKEQAKPKDTSAKEDAGSKESTKDSDAGSADAGSKESDSKPVTVQTEPPTVEHKKPKADPRDDGPGLPCVPPICLPTEEPPTEEPPTEEPPTEEPPTEEPPTQEPPTEEPPTTIPSQPDGGNTGGGQEGPVDLGDTGVTAEKKADAKLPVTGSQVFGVASVGAALFGAGAFVMLFTRRRKEEVVLISETPKPTDES